MTRRDPLRLQDQLDYELMWRRKELTTLKMNADAVSTPDLIDSMIRVMIIILYAHWEGFVKQSIGHYLRHVRLNAGDPSALSVEMIAIGLRSKNLKGDEGLDLTKYIKAVNWLIGSEKSYKKFPRIESTFSRVGNLKYKKFRDLTRIIGVDMSKYDTKERIIDEKLLKSRNEVAHGKHSPVDTVVFEEVYYVVMTILTELKDRIVDAAWNKSYLRH